MFVWTCLVTPSSPPPSWGTGSAFWLPDLRPDLVTRYWRPRGWRLTLWSRAEAFYPFTIILSGGKITRPWARFVSKCCLALFSFTPWCWLNNEWLWQSSLRCCVFSSWEIHIDCSWLMPQSPLSRGDPSSAVAARPAWGRWPQRGM